MDTDAAYDLLDDMDFDRYGKVYCPEIERMLPMLNQMVATVMDRMAPTLFKENEKEVVNELFPTCPKISIDYAVMEKTDLAYVEPAEFGWSDLGTWGSLYGILNHDDSGNAVIGDQVKLVECSGCVVSVPKQKQVVIQGLSDCIVSEYNDTLLICRLSDEQRIKDWHD